MNRFFKSMRWLCALFVLSVFASQCFAKSKASSAESNYQKTKQYLDIINNVFVHVLNNYADEVDPEVLYKGAMDGLMKSLNDPHSVYLDQKSMGSLLETTTGGFGGVGLSISKLTETSPDKPAFVQVVSPIEDTPGYKAGIQSGDLIISINGIDTSTITMDEVLSHLRGEPDTSVDLVIRRGKGNDFSVTLKRAVIEVPCVKYDTIGKTGFIRIIEFTPRVPDHVQEALDDFEKKGCTSLIIDLRGNPGGLITSVYEVADKFISKGPIVSTKSRLSYENKTYSASASKTTVKKAMPIIVLINKGSASASEILSGALKDTRLAYLVGERSYGKGSVQYPIPLPNKDGFKLTIAKYYTPSDTNIDKIGIPPDREVRFPEFSAEEEKTYLELLTSDELPKYVEAHPGMTEAQIALYAKELAKTHKLEERVLRRLVRLEVNRAKPAPVYDLDFDVQLNAALDILKNEDFSKLMKKTKTLKQLQQEAEAKEKAAAKK